MVSNGNINLVSEFPERILRKELDKYFKLKPESIGPPKFHLGAGVRRVTLENGVNTWAVSSS